MSHYLVAVIRDTEKSLSLEDMMAPYDEEVKVAPYVDLTKTEIINKVKEIQRRALEKETFLEGDSIIRSISSDEEYYDYYRNEWYEDGWYDEDGNLLTTYNPNSKWDWYDVGGRWNGVLRIKDEFVYEELGEVPVEGEKYYTNSAPIGHLDLTDFINTYAVVTPDGRWHEPGKMGWFGISYASKEDEASWDEGFYDRFIRNANPEWEITIVDCHI